VNSLGFRNIFVPETFDGGSREETDMRLGIQTWCIVQSISRRKFQDAVGPVVPVSFIRSPGEYSEAPHEPFFAHGVLAQYAFTRPKTLRSLAMHRVQSAAHLRAGRAEP
jgi:hypothetical protein